MDVDEEDDEQEEERTEDQASPAADASVGNGKAIAPVKRSARTIDDDYGDDEEEDEEENEVEETEDVVLKCRCCSTSG